MISLDKGSADLCLFKHLFSAGCYEYLRLSYGINSKLYFSTMMTEIFSDLERAVVIIGDILVWGIDLKSHHKILENVFKKS